MTSRQRLAFIILQLNYGYRSWREALVHRLRRSPNTRAAFSELASAGTGGSRGGVEEEQPAGASVSRPAQKQGKSGQNARGSCLDGGARIT